MERETGQRYRHARFASRDRSSRLDSKCSTEKDIRLDVLFCRARDGTRTRGLDLGKVALHQLSHSRNVFLVLRLVYVIKGEMKSQRFFQLFRLSGDV